jgi:hypothetical protein
MASLLSQEARGLGQDSVEKFGATEAIDSIHAKTKTISKKRTQPVAEGLADEMEAYKSSKDGASEGWLAPQDARALKSRSHV